MHLSTTLFLAGCLSSVEEHQAFLDELKDRDGDGFVSIESGGQDCDDGDARVYPGAFDRPYDGLDADCAGDDDYDADSDGHRPWVYEGEDCDDTDFEVHPEAVEVCGDGLDNDCDGGAGECAYLGELSPLDATATWLGEDGRDRLGESVAAGGGGLAWTYGALDGPFRIGWVRDVSSTETQTDVPHAFLLEDDLSSSQSWVEHSALVFGGFGGHDEVGLAVTLKTRSVFNNPETLGVFLFESPSAFSEAQVLRSAESLEHYSLAGWEHSETRGGLVVGACGGQRAWMLEDPADLASLEDGLQLEAGAGPEMWGCVVEDAGDMDGDGLHEVALGDGIGAMWIVWGEHLIGALGVLDVSELAGRLQVEEATGELGSAMAGLGDIDGDGRAELAIGMPCGQALGCEGRVWLLGEDLEANVQVVEGSPGFGAFLSGGQDATGDGVPDFLVGGTNEQAHLFSGQVYSGVVGSSFAVASLAIPGLGSGCLSPDMDDNQLAELVVGAPRAVELEAPGEVMLFMAPGL